MLDTFRQDIRFTLRTLARSPGFVVVMILTLALGIGANTAIFSVVESVLLKPLPYPRGEQLVQLWSTGGLGGMAGATRSRMSLSYQQVQDAGGLHDDFTGLAAYTGGRYNLTGIGEPREVQADLVSPSFFAVLGVRPMLGRSFTESELRDPVIVLSYGLWTQLFGNDPNAVGRQVTLDDRSYTVVGVMPAGFAFPNDGTQLWAPLGLAFAAQPDMETNPGFHALNAVARLHGGVSLERVQSDLGVLAARRASPPRAPGGGEQPGGQPGGRRIVRMGAAGPAAGAGPGGKAAEVAPPAGSFRGRALPSNPPPGAPPSPGSQQEVVVRGGPPSSAGGGSHPRARPGGARLSMSTGYAVERLRDEVVGNARTPILILMAVVGFVLIIACVNAANLLLARASARQRELAVRRALGAGRGRLVRQLLTESVLLGLAGGLFGLVFADVGLSAILAAWPSVLPRTHAIGLDGATLAFAFVVAVVTGVAFGLAPALRSSGMGVDAALREGGASVTPGPGRHRLQRGLVVAEIALALVVLTGAGLLVRSFVHLSEVKPGYDTHGVLAARIRLTPERYQSQAQQQAFFQQVVQDLERRPDVETASVSATLPMSGQVQMLGIDPRTIRPDNPEPFLAMGFDQVGPGFFRALRVPLLAGRGFTDQDREGAQRVAVVNQALAKRLWPGRSPIGQVISMPVPGVGKPRQTSDVAIVGEIGDVHYASLTDPVKPEIYFPFAQSGSVNREGAWIVARATRDPMAMAGAMRHAVASVDPEQPVATLTTLSQMVSRSTASRRFNMTLVGVFALLAFGLALVGIYGVTAYTVEQRTQELGVRVALGAERRNVVGLLLGETAVMALIGVALGLVGAFGATRVLTSLLYDVSTTDALTFSLTAAVLAACALLAALVPALRASRVDPVEALKYE